MRRGGNLMLESVGEELCLPPFVHSNVASCLAQQNTG